MNYCYIVFAYAKCDLLIADLKQRIPPGNKYKIAAYNNTKWHQKLILITDSSSFIERMHCAVEKEHTVHKVQKAKMLQKCSNRFFTAKID